MDGWGTITWSCSDQTRPHNVQKFRKPMRNSPTSLANRIAVLPWQNEYLIRLQGNLNGDAVIQFEFSYAGLSFPWKPSLISIFTHSYIWLVQNDSSVPWRSHVSWFLNSLSKSPEKRKLVVEFLSPVVQFWLTYFISIKLYFRQSFPFQLISIRFHCNFYSYSTTTITITITITMTTFVTPESLDVLCGRGISCHQHPGNKFLRQLIDRNLPKYASADSKSDKSSILRDIIRSILTQGGRFLKKDSDTEFYYEAGMKAAR